MPSKPASTLSKARAPADNTGTPTGAGIRFDPPRFLQPGDVVEVEVAGVGVLRNTVEAEQ